MKWMLLALCLWAQAARGQEEGAHARPGLIPPSGLMIFYHSSGPLSFVTATPGELPPGAVPIGEVRGQSCQYGLSVPLSLSLNATNVSADVGNGGYEKTLQEIHRANPNLSGIYDVKVDLHVTSILGIYRRVCTEITARGFR